MGSVIIMSMQTTLRYEIGAGKSQVQRRRQQERIKFDEQNDDRQKQNKLAHLCDLNADWVENLEPTRKIALYKTNKISVKSELHNANKALLRVRRAELRKLLMEEEEEQAIRLRKECNKVMYLGRE